MLFPLLSKTRFRRPNRSITHEYAILPHLYRLHLWMNLLRSIPRKRDSHERDSFSISFLPSTRREIRSESLSRNERHPRTLKNGWKKKPGCTFGEHKNLSSVYLDRSRSRGDQPPWFRRSPSVALQLFHATKKRKEEGKIGFSKFRTLLSRRSDFAFRFNFCLPQFCGNKERGRVITGG